MDEKLIALKHIIFNFAQNQFTANETTPIEAAFIMEAIAGQFQKICLESVIMGMVSVNQEQKIPVEEHMETAEDLKRALDKMVIEKECAAE